MPDNNDLGILSDIIGAIQHFGERVTVQRQLTVILLIIAVSWLLTALFWYYTRRFLDTWVDNQEPGRKKKYATYIISILRNTLFPILVFFVLGRTEVYFSNRGWPSGLINDLRFLFLIVFIYRFIIGGLYARLDKYAARRYHHRFLAPLLAIFVIGWLLNHLVPIQRLAAVELWSGFTNPVTLGAILIATVGFYFWFDGSGVAQDIARFVARPFTRADSGALEAGLIIGRYVLIAIGIYIVFTVLGFDSTTLAFLTAGLSVGIGFGLKEVIGNLISGVLLLIDQSLRPGDVISLEGQIGTVKHVGIRATIVQTLNNVDVVVPNQTFLTAAVTSFARGDSPVRMLIPVETSDSHTPHEVRNALLTVAKKHPLVLDQPESNVFYKSTGDTSRNYELVVWYEDPLKTTPLHSDLYYMIFDEFDKQGINPATPQRDLNITNMSGNGIAATPSG